MILRIVFTRRRLEFCQYLTNGYTLTQLEAASTK